MSSTDEELIIEMRDWRFCGSRSQRVRGAVSTVSSSYKVGANSARCRPFREIAKSLLRMTRKCDQERNTLQVFTRPNIGAKWPLDEAPPPSCQTLT